VLVTVFPTAARGLPARRSPPIEEEFTVSVTDENRVTSSRLQDPKTWAWPFIVLGAMAGVVVADQLLPGFSLGGPLTRQLATAAFLTAVLTTASVVLTKVLRRALGGRGRASLLYTVASPVVFWLAVRLGQALELPVALTGFWSTVGASLLVDVTAIVASLGYALVASVVRREHRRLSAGVLVDYVSGLAGLWIAVATLDGVRLGPEPVAARLFTTIVFAALFLLFTCPVRLTMVGFGPRLTRIAHAAVVVVDTIIATLVLRALCWLSSWTPTVVSVDGFWTSLLTVLLMTAVLWARRVPDWLRLEGPPHVPDRVEGLDVRFGGLLVICLFALAWLVGYGLWALVF
jgi:hypothetical protein